MGSTERMQRSLKRSLSPEVLTLDNRQIKEYNNVFQAIYSSEKYKSLKRKKRRYCKTRAPLIAWFISAAIMKWLTLLVWVSPVIVLPAIDVESSPKFSSEKMFYLVYFWWLSLGLSLTIFFPGFPMILAFCESLSN